ncbi:uncharacterized protein CCOS01_15503 [Colletotrichum costaricense]|uniref:Uncharacterized protein n=1 Tax=Colletotrichum costaricense TaxID=1209916 RepID=A0AAI9YH80_9PEZI|nr:uncharacterized protein CCOS01_15503 [Colletotrichum costaricense]KAK1509409.1 hypothetical protein CCOS01_15503 [Colletotrichum costaricense]
MLSRVVGPRDSVWNGNGSVLTEAICKTTRSITDASCKQVKTRKEPHLEHTAALDLDSDDESHVATGRSRAWHHFSRVDHLANVGLG